jgi:superfamily II DNA/RNA helicase
MLLCVHTFTFSIALTMYVQNYDFPNNLEDYVHRIGRTGVSYHDFLPLFFMLIMSSSERGWKALRTRSSLLRMHA